MNAVQNNNVQERIVLSGGYMVSINIPEGAKRLTYSVEGMEIPYLQFPRNVRGGVVNIHLHGDDEALAKILGKSQKITALATVHQKTVANGMTYTYVDLELSKVRSPATYRLVIEQDVPDGVAESELFPLAQAEGVVAFIPAGAKLKSQAATTHIQPALKDSADDLRKKFRPRG